MTFRTLIQPYIPYVATHASRFGGSLALTIVQVVSLIPIPFLVESVFRTLSQKGEIWSLVTEIGVVFFLVVVSAVASIFNRHITLSFIKEAVARLRSDLVKRTLGRSRTEHTTFELDALHTDIVYGTERIDCMASAFLTQVIPGALVGIGIGMVLAYLNPTLAFVVFLAIPVLYMGVRVVSTRVQKLVKKFHTDFSHFSEGIFFALHFHELIKMSGAEAYESERQQRMIQNLRVSSGAMALLSTVYTIVQGNAMVLVGVIVLLVGGIQIIFGSATLGIVISFYIALNVLVSHVRVAVGALPTVVEGLESLRALRMFLDEKYMVIQNEHEIERIYCIDVEGVSFGHTKETVLRNINMRIADGEMVGLYGPSGSGKTTIANLILGLYRPQDGTIHIDGVALSNIDEQAYRARIGVLTQGLSIFSGTIRANLTYGHEDVSDDLLREMCTICEIQDYIDSLPDRYDTHVGDRGTVLSGGQRQRIALARALIRRPDVLILDEPDNNLDLAMIERILDRIRAQKIATLVITHNQSLEKYFDRAYVCVKDRDVTVVREKSM